MNLPRRVLLDLIKRTNTDLKSVSERLGRNHAYLQQYVARGTPRVLSDHIRQELGKIFDVHPNVFLDETDPRWVEYDGMKKKPTVQPAPAELVKKKEHIVKEESNICRIPEYDSFLFLKYGKKVKPLSFWSFPREYIEHYTAEIDNLALLCVCGDGMAPEYQDGDYVLVDLGSKYPSPSGLYLLGDGTNIVLKNVEIMAGIKPARARLVSANPIYGSYDVPLEDLNIFGRVLGRWRWQ